MKKIALFILIFLAQSENLICQNSIFAEIFNSRSIINIPILLNECDSIGNIQPQTQLMQRNWVIEPHFPDKDSLVIEIPPFTDDSPYSNYLNNNVVFTDSSRKKRKYYKISLEDYSKNTEIERNKGHFFVSGSTTFLKIRFGNGKYDKNSQDNNNEAISSQFTNDFNAGLILGYKFQPKLRKPISFGVNIGLNYTHINITPEDSNNFLNSNTSAAGISPSIGVSLEINKFIIAPFLGMDILPGELSNYWVYNGRIWLGLGLGYKVFQATGKDGN